MQLDEESLTRELETAAQRVDRLSAISDGLLTETVAVDDRSTLEAQIEVSRGRVTQLEAELLQIRTERSALQREIAVQLASETPFSAAANQQRDVTLGVREGSIELELSTVSQRIISLESALATSALDNQVVSGGEQVDEELVLARGVVTEIEVQLLDVRTRRAELAQSAATKPSLIRRVERLEQDLALLDAQIASSAITAGSPSPIEVLTQPVLLAEPANNPKVTWAAYKLFWDSFSRPIEKLDQERL